MEISEHTDQTERQTSQECKHDFVPFAKMEDDSTKFICKWCGKFE